MQDVSEALDTRNFVFIDMTKKIRYFLREWAYKLMAEIEARLAFMGSSVPVLVYQMGKVGSSTVYKSLKKASLPNPIFHLHFLSDDLLKHRETHQKAGVHIPYHIILGEAIHRKMAKKPKTEYKIISLVRDPIAYVVSNVFQNPHFASQNIKIDGGSIEPNKVRLYLTEMLSEPDAFKYVNEWFDRELKSVFAIDVFAEPFRVNLGYTIYRGAYAEALVIRLEDLSQKGPEAVAKFLGLDSPLSLKQTNSRSQSDEADTYQRVKKEIGISKDLCREIYSSKFAKHFYNEAMIDKFIAKWVGE